MSIRRTLVILGPPMIAGLLLDNMKNVGPEGFEPSTSGILSLSAICYRQWSYKTGALTRLNYGPIGFEVDRPLIKLYDCEEIL